MACPGINSQFLATTFLTVYEGVLEVGIIQFSLDNPTYMGPHHRWIIDSNKKNNFIMNIHV